MKTLCNIVLLLLTPAFLFANDGILSGRYNKQKRIQKAYKVDPDAGIDIQNQFGPVFVTTWDEDKVELDILVKVSGNDENWVNRRLESIDVDINALSSLVSARTKFGSMSGKTGNSNSIEISYTVKIPKKGGVKISNKYGDVISNDLFGPANLSVQYGNLKLANLNHPNNSLHLQYCSSVHIGRIKSGSIRADYSKLNIGDFDSLALDTDYTDVNAQGPGNVTFQSDYGKLKFAKAGNVSGKGNYLTVNIGDLNGGFSLQSDYSTAKIADIGNSGGNISVIGNYNTVSLEYPDNAAFDFELAGKYTNFRIDDELEITHRIETNRDKVLKGYCKRQGARHIAVHGQYGNISLKNN